MAIVNMHDAKSSLSQLVERAGAGEEIVIARAGQPVARLVPYVPRPSMASIRGALKGKVVLHEGWDEPEDELWVEALR